jgi:hypothetical protein
MGSDAHSNDAPQVRLTLPRHATPRHAAPRCATLRHAALRRFVTKALSRS